MMPRRATTTVERRDLTVQEARSASSPSHRARAAREASLAARSQRQREAMDNPVCPTCDGRTIQNDPERARRVWWCMSCQSYPFGSGFGPDRIEPVTGQRERTPLMLKPDEDGVGGCGSRRICVSSYLHAEGSGRETDREERSQ